MSYISCFLENDCPANTEAVEVNEDFLAMVERLIPGFTSLFSEQVLQVTREREVNVSIARAAMGTTPEKARQYVEGVGETFLNLITGMLGELLVAEDVKAAILEKLAKCDEARGKRVIAPSATAAKHADGGISAKDSIEYQLQRLRVNLATLQDNKCLSSDVNFAVDPTHFRKTTKRLPRHVRYIVTGTRATKRRGIHVMDIYDTTHGFNVISYFEQPCRKGARRKAMPDWIAVFQQVLAIYAEFGITAASVLADRDFASAYNFGAFSSGKLDEVLGANTPIRLVEPTKFYNDNPKDGDNPVDAPDWKVGTIKLWQKDIKSLPDLVKFLGGFVAQSRSANVEVPVVNLAFFEDGETFQPLSESAIGAKVQGARKSIARLEKKLGNAYVAYQKLRRHTKLKKRTQNKWLYKRAGNKVLKGETPEMHALWVEGQRLKALLEKAHKRLAKVKKQLRFYTVSITPAEREILQSGTDRQQKALIRRLVQACYEYHQRWSIENYFEMLKRDILHIGKTRCINWLRQQWLQAQTIYNAYILARTFAIAAEKRKRWPRWKPFDSKLKTRKKPLRAADYHLLSFNQFIGTITKRCLEVQLCKAFA